MSHDPLACSDAPRPAPMLFPQSALTNRLANPAIGAASASDRNWDWGAWAGSFACWLNEPLVTADGEPWPAMRLKRSFRGHQLRHHPVGGRATFRRGEQVAIDWQHSENYGDRLPDGSLETVVVATDQTQGTARMGSQDKHPIGSVADQTFGPAARRATARHWGR